MDNEVMNVLLCIDDFKWNYTRHCAVTILSLLETNKNHKIKIFIMSSYLPEENVEELKRIVKLYNQEIEFIIHDDIVSEEIKHSVINRRNLTRWTWYRLFFPLYIKKIDRLLYMDCDVLVNGDIENIYFMDMQWKAISWYFDNTSNRFFSEHNFQIKQYINAWVILIDVKKFLSHNIVPESIIKINEKYWTYIDNSDQDYLNIIFKDDIYIYNKSMNYQIVGKYFNIWLSDAKIIHLLQKPYAAIQDSNCPNELVNLYNHYLSLTKWKGYPKEKYNQWNIKYICDFIYSHTKFFHWNFLMRILWDDIMKKLVLFKYRIGKKV